jgi:hypothetical protein
MQIEVPPEVGRQLVKECLCEGLRMKSQKEFPLECLIFNLFTQSLRDRIFELADRNITAKHVAKQDERNGLLIALLTMVVHKLGTKDTVEIQRAVDGNWFEGTDLQLKIDQSDPEKIILTVEEDDE